MQNILNDLVETLKKDDRFVVEGQLVKNKVVELALTLDPGLLKLLLTNKAMKKHFFQDIEGVLIFDKVEFQRFVSNKQFLPDSYTAFKNKIGLTARGEYLTESKEVVLAWPYKDCVLEGGQTKDDKTRKEIFWNTTLAPDEIDRLLSPKVLTNFKSRHRKDAGTVRAVSLKDNLIIEGNNLLSLVSLGKVYASRIKLIYIDPPYNTQGDANTFLYNNSFNHSSWLTFMHTRLQLAKGLLTKDGVIAVAIDDEEQAYLKLVCDEVFGRANYMGTLVVQIKPSGRTNDAYLATSHEYVMFYSKEPDQPSINFFELSKKEKEKYNEGEGDNMHKWRDFLRTGGYSTPEERENSYYPIYYNPITSDISLENKGADYVQILPIDSNCTARVWRKTPPSFLKHLRAKEIQVTTRRNGEYKVQIIDRIKKGVRPKSVWVDSKYDATSHGTKLLKKMFGGEKVFSFPKSLHAVKDVIHLFTTPGGTDIVLDFFAGSGTTGHAVLQLNKEDGGNRSFILCEQMDYVKSVIIERIDLAIEELESPASYLYCSLAELNASYLTRISQAKTTQDLEHIWVEMEETGRINYRISPKSPTDNVKAFAELTISEKKQFLNEAVDMNQIYVNYSEIDDGSHHISEIDKQLNHQFYNLK